MAKSIFDRYYRRYDLWYTRNTFAYFSELAAIKKALPRNGKGLEIGVGTGRFASALGIRYGVDPSQKMLTLAKKRGILVKKGRGEKLPFARAAFDYVALIIAFCFVKDPRAVLRETRRVLRRNGTIVLGIVDRESFLGAFYRAKKSVFYKHARFFSVRETAELLKEAGFARFSYYQTLSTLPGMMRSVERPKKGFGKGGFVVIAGKKI
jgi:SAM-dependent methyltransferase